MSPTEDLMERILDWLSIVPWWGWAGAAALFVFVVMVLIIVLTRRGRGGVAARPAARPASPQVVQAGPPAHAPPPMTGGVTLTAISGPAKGRRYDIRLTGRTILGRNPQVCDVVVQDDDMISGRHCEFRLESGRVMVRDLESLNGTIVNGATITSFIQVVDGDVLLLGESEFKAAIS